MPKNIRTKWSSLGGDIIDLPRVKSTYKAREVIMPEWLTRYMLERDRVLWGLFVDSRTEIEALHSGVNFGFEMEYEEYRCSEIEFINVSQIIMEL